MIGEEIGFETTFTVEEMQYLASIPDLEYPDQYPDSQMDNTTSWLPLIREPHRSWTPCAQIGCPLLYSHYHDGVLYYRHGEWIVRWPHLLNVAWRHCMEWVEKIHRLEGHEDTLMERVNWIMTNE